MSRPAPARGIARLLKAQSSTAAAEKAKRPRKAA